MPQLDFSVFPSQFFWLAINFFLMLLVFGKFILPKTAEMINLRKQKIDGDIEKAAEIKKQVELALEKYNKALNDANDKARISLQKTRDELNETIRCRQADLDARLQAEIKACEKRIDASKNKALQKVDDMAAELSVEILKKLGFAGINVKDAKNALAVLKKEN